MKTRKQTVDLEYDGQPTTESEIEVTDPATSSTAAYQPETAIQTSSNTWTEERRGRRRTGYRLIISTGY
ncbi:hypothetical protein MJO29_006407 [Puccinia striiformis f. sp. tritici]|nr:hypothetical protein MJO29_006407 [Puccinia striiformis f. sp. tritici]